MRCFAFGNSTIRTWACCFWLATVMATGANATETGTLVGTVVGAESFQPLAGVHISIINKLQTATTDSSGRFLIELPAGTFILGARHSGYDVLHEQIEVAVGDTLDVQIELTPIVIQVSEMVTGGRLAGGKTILPAISAFISSPSGHGGRSAIELEQLIQSIVPLRVF